MSAHKQVWAKVNAQIDTEIAELVEVLSAFPSLQTVESCQGGESQPAWVCFTYGDRWAESWKDIAEFVLEFLAPRLAREIGDDAHLSIEPSGSGIVQGHLTIRAGSVQQTVEALRQLLPNTSCYPRP